MLPLKDEHSFTFFLIFLKLACVTLLLIVGFQKELIPVSVRVGVDIFIRVADFFTEFINH